MPRSTQKERDYRSELLSHMYHFHGGYSNDAGERWSLDELEKMHNMMHIDGFACPPHEHKKTEDPYTLGKIKLKYKDYISQIKGAILDARSH